MKLMKLLLACVLLMVLAACSKVPAGNVGIKVYLLGGQKGVDTEQLGPGRYWIGWNEDLYLFPTFKQNKVWTNGPAEEGKAAEGAFVFGTIDGMKVSSDIGISYRIKPGSAPKLFQDYRKGIDEITDVDIRNMVASEFVTRASSRRVDTVYGSGKEQLLKDVESAVRARLDPQGIELIALYWSGDLRLPSEVTASINAKIKATQMAEQRRNEVEQAKAEADKARQTAQGEADAKLMLAEAEAKSIQIKGDALRQNQELVSLTVAEKWNGQYPTTLITGPAGGQILQIPLQAK